MLSHGLRTTANMQPSLACQGRSGLSRLPTAFCKQWSSQLRLPAQLRAAVQLGRAGSRAQRSSSALAAQAVAAPEAPSIPAPGAPAELPQEAHGFKLVRQQWVAEYNSQVALYKHDKTGAEVMSLVNSDENKTFGAVFRTPVENSKGIPHILEHSVLCGSRKYPIKEPFVELMKGSLNTFLNAFTYPDRTCYPVASANLQDFYNLVDVYLDAVLYPNCIRDPGTFAQEGWHYELEDPKDELTFKGVVFNEMKGVYSSPDSVNMRTVQQSLFPNNSYGEDSGGDPRAIPDLTFDEFKDFHQHYYHPSNARFWFYGDDSPEERLSLLAKYLDEFEARPVDSAVKGQPRLQEPSKVVDRYAAGEDSSEEPKAFVSLNWVLAEEAFDLETELAFGFLDYLMLGTSAAPLRRALNESGLGESLIGGGLSDDLRQPIFSLGLKGVEPANAEKVTQLIMDELARLSKEGFTDTAIEAAINSIEFDLRENNTGRFPRGLSLMLRAMSSWIYDKDPFQPLQWTSSLQHFKDRLASGEDVFGPLIQRYLLDNTHRITVELLPDAELAEKEDAEEKARLADFKQKLVDQELQEIVKSTQELKARQETPEEPAALNCIPTLHLGDIPRQAPIVPTQLSETRGVQLLQHDLFTNDVLYLTAALDLRGVPVDLLPLLPLFCRSLTQMGTDAEDFVTLSERIGRKTGGVSFSPFVSAVKGQEQPVAYLMARGKVMGNKAGDLLDLLRDILLRAQLNDKERFKQMALETKAGLEAGVVGSGHSIAATRLDAQRSIAGWVSEQMGGLSYLMYIRELVAKVDSDWDAVQADLRRIRDLLLQRRGALVNLTGDETALQAASPHVDAFLDALPAEAGAVADWAGCLPALNEAITVPTQVNYVGKGANLYADAGYQLHGSSYVINKLLGTTWIWDRVRVSGGAYGGFSDFDTHSGMFTYLSYRDPNLLKTVENYDGTVDFLRSLELDQDSLTKAIIGAVGDIDAYQLPDSKGHTAFMRHLLKISDADRQERREQILGTSVKDFRNFADVLECVRGDKARVVAVTNAERARNVNDKEKPGFFDQITKAL